MVNLTDLYLDRTKMNPKAIASELMKIGCPFSCTYIDYNIKLIYKKADTSIDPGVLQLMFYLDGQSSWRTTIKDLDYTHDMLVSDYGSIFGVLVGLSLIDMVVYFFSAVKSLFLGCFKCSDRDVTGHGKRHLYEFAKWLLIAGSIGVLAFLTFSKDFQDLDQTFATRNDTNISSKHSTPSGFLNTNKESEEDQSLDISWGPDLTGTVKAHGSASIR